MWKKGQGSLRPVTAGMGVNGLKKGKSMLLFFYPYFEFTKDCMFPASMAKVSFLPSADTRKRASSSREHTILCKFKPL